MEVWTGSGECFPNDSITREITIGVGVGDNLWRNVFRQDMCVELSTCPTAQPSTRLFTKPTAQPSRGSSLSPFHYSLVFGLWSLVFF
jgi:hypothetical protein